MTGGVRTTPENFWQFVQKGNGCWLWQGSKSPKGYGVISYQGKAWRAHRLAYKFTRGDIPAGLCVLHRCDNPSCVRPDHLFLGTHGENNTDRARKGRNATGERHGSKTKPERLPVGDRHGSRKHPESWRRGETHHNTTLVADDIKKIRKLYQPGINTRSLAQQFNVSMDTIRRIATFKTWGHIR